MKELRFILVMMIVISIIWVGFGIFFSNNGVTINPNAQSYVKPINKAFDLDGFDQLVIRTEENLPVSPEDLRDLVQTQDN